MKTSNRVRKQPGFTLIEIIIVVVILGILAAVALPKLVQNIGKSTASEAFNIGSAWAKAMDRCVEERTGGTTPVLADYNACNAFAELTPDYMLTPPATNFTYTTPACAVTTCTMVATAVAGRGLAVTDTITFSSNFSNGAVTKACVGNFVTMCK